MATNQKIIVTRNGIGFFGLLTILFIGLKLSGHIQWSWWLVLLPLYWPFAAIFLFLVTAFLVVAVADTLDRRNRLRLTRR